MGLTAARWPESDPGLYHEQPVDGGSDPQAHVAKIDGMTSTVRLDNETSAIDLLATAEAVGDLPAGSLLVLVTDDDANLVIPIGIDDVPADPPQDERVGMLASLVHELTRIGRCGGVLLAVGRAGHPRPRGSNFGWHDAFAMTVNAGELDCHGTYVVTPSGVRRVRPLLAPPELSAA